MNVAERPAVKSWTTAELLDHVGDIPLDRVRLTPPPGSATEEDLLHVLTVENIPCELIDGVLVERPMASNESGLGVYIASMLLAFVRQRDLGKVTGERGPYRLRTGLTLEPDVGFAGWDRLEKHGDPTDKVAPCGPEFAVEVLCEGNTADEIRRKIRQYFTHGARLVWIVDPSARTVTVHGSPESKSILREDAALGGGDVLPGFELPVAEIFGEWDRLVRRAAKRGK